MSPPLRLFLAFVGFSLLPFPSQSQTTMTWEAESATHTFCLVINPQPYPEEADRVEMYRMESLRIVDRQHGKEQNFPLDIMERVYLDTTRYWELIDMNFDGYMDVRVLEISSYFQIFKSYIYHPETKTFALDSALSEVDNPEFDPNSKTVHSFWRGGLSEFGHALYDWKNGELKLRWKEVMDVNMMEEVKNTVYLSRYEGDKLVEEAEAHSLAHPNFYHPMEECGKPNTRFKDHR